MPATDVRFPAADGRRLQGTWRAPLRPRAAILLAGATAVPERAYAALAENLADSGLAVLTFDYRGVGKSKATRLRQEGASMADWGRLDLEGALLWLGGQAAALPLLLFGHSVGGQLLGLAPSAGRLRGALLVGAQSGYWRHWDGNARLRMWLNWHLVLPGVTRALGYAPMGALRMGEDLPPGVAQQWARWGRHPEHLLSECTAVEKEAYVRLGFPIRSYHFSDDAFAPRRAVEALAAFYGGTSPEVVTRAPKDVGTCSIGHFGWLKPAFRDTLWREMTGWLLHRVDEIASHTHPIAEVRSLSGETAGRRGPLRPRDEPSTRAG